MKKVDLTTFASLIGDSFTSQVELLERAIGSSHYPSIGVYKERLLAKILRQYLPQNIEVATGFVLFPREAKASETHTHFDQLNQCVFDPSKQIDIIVFDSSVAPVVFRDQDFVVVRPEAVRAIIEVKGTLTYEAIDETLESFLDFGLKWRNSQVFYRKHHQPLTARPSLLLMAWSHRIKCKNRLALANGVRKKICSYYKSRVSLDRSDGLPLLEMALIHNNLIVQQTGRILKENEKYVTDLGWASSEGKFLRYTQAGKIEPTGDKTISSLLANIQYQMRDQKFNRFFSYVDEIKGHANLNSETDGFSVCWSSPSTKLVKRFNSDFLQN